MSHYTNRAYTFVLTLVLMNPDIPCLCTQCRSRSNGFWRSQLIWICTDQLASEEANWPGSTLFVIKYLYLCQQSWSSSLIGWKLEVGGASIYSAWQGLESFNGTGPDTLGRFVVMETILWLSVCLTHLSLATHKRDTGKQCRPRSDAAVCGVWSGSTLFSLH